MVYELLQRRLSSVAFHSHMNNLCENYDPDAADAMYESYVEGEDVEVTKASQSSAQSTFAENSLRNMKTKERKTKKRVLCGYTSAHQIH
jgi:hypothetical protein